MQPEVNILITLANSVGIIKETFREIVISELSKNNVSNPNLPSFMNYNCIPYMQLLIYEMFKSDTAVDKIPPSTLLLIRDGLGHRHALELAQDVFKYTVDSIAAVLPELTFTNSHEYQIDFCNECDLLVSKYRSF